MPNGKKICKSVAEYMRKAIIWLVSGVRFAVKIRFIGWLRLLPYGYEDFTMPRSRRGMVLCLCSLILTFVCGCKQAPWESLTPQYSNKNPPPFYSISSIETTQNLNSIAVSGDGQTLWAVGDVGLIMKSQDSGQHWATVASGTTNTLYSIAVSFDGQWGCPLG